ncbi:MAG: LarC family nickel insertion protein [Spirochaetia bacterium]|nr:LarC family nickel insertion protein [Spirochaetia bacterium]
MIAYFDCFAGASGDMLVGALLDCGLDRDRWLAQIKPLFPERWDVKAEKVSKQGISSTKFSVFQNGALAEDPTIAPIPSHLVFHAKKEVSGPLVQARLPDDHSHRTLSEVLGHLSRARLSPAAAELAHKVFRLLAVCEAHVHGMPVDEVHFHEVGAVDAVIDIAGFAAAFDEHKITQAVVSPLVTGAGTVQTSHGVLPVPPPVVLEIIKRAGAPVRSADIPFEALTPTGAAILCTIASSYGPPPDFKKVSAVGYGAGTREGIGTPNVTRVTIGEGI